MIIRQRARKVALAAVTAAAIPLGMIAAAPPAQAASAPYVGKVLTGLNVRSAPTSASSRVTTLRAGTKVTIQCKVFGPSVRGNSLWYKLSTGRWSTARYISNIGAAPRFCGTGKEYTGRIVTSSLAVRSGPNTANSKVSSVRRGQTVFIACKVNSQRIGGNPRWYQLTGDGGGQWVSARYVANVGAIPAYC